MKSCIAILLALFSVTSFSQEKKMSYYFDFYTIQKSNNYTTGIKAKNIFFSNKNDSTYSLIIVEGKIKNSAYLSDKKKKKSIAFDANFDFEKIEDLNKLNNSKLYTVVQYIRSKKYKNYVSDYEYETDSITKKTIVHVTQFNNKKRKKIINEHYYFFGVNNNLVAESKNSVKKYFNKEYNMTIRNDESLEKVLCIVDGKIQSENEFIETKDVDFKFDFKIDEEYPKYNFTTTNTQQ